MAKTVIGRNLPLYKGNYDSNTTYDIYDVVVLNGSSYVSKKTNNLGNNPETNAEYWQLLAKSGTKGDKGNKGEKGDTPVAGVDYYTNEERERFKNAVIDASKQDIENLTETKITEFNSNATEKTNTFNSNSTQKISDYNDNHTAKLSEYNRTAEEVINSFDIVSEYIDAEHETVVTDENIETTINDSAKWYGKIDARGRTEQEQYNGKNLFNISASSGKNGGVEVTVANNKLTMEAISTNGSQFAIYIIDGLDETKTYNFSFKAKKIVKGTDGDGRIRAYLAGSNDGENYTRIAYADIANPEIGTEYSLSNNFTGYEYFRVYLYNNNSTPVTVGEKVEYYDVQLEEGDTATTYEPFVGKQPSPNAEYPQEIKNVTGSVDFKVGGENFFDVAAYSGKNGGVELTTENNKLTLEATGTSGAQYAIYMIDNLDTTKTYNFVFKAKMLIKGISGAPRLRLQASGSNDDGGTYTRVAYVDIGNPEVNKEHLITASWTGYKKIKMYLYLNTSSPVTVGEKVEYYDFYLAENKQTVTFPFAEDQKLMNGDYLAGDGIHHVKGQSTIQIRSITTNSDGYAMAVITIPNKIAKTNNYLKCDRAITANSGRNRVWENQLNITVIGDENDTLETMKQKYDGAVVEYELGNETIDAYIPAQQEARNQLQKLMLNYGTNHIWTETDGLNPNIKITYKKSNRIKNENEIENIKNAIISMGGNI